MTCYKFKCSHWLKIYLKKNPLQDLLSSLAAVISTNESTEFIPGHVIYNQAYTSKFQLKTTFEGHDFEMNSPLLIYTGYPLSEYLIFASINPKYDDRLFIELRVLYKKTTSSVQ